MSETLRSQEAGVPVLSQRVWGHAFMASVRRHLACLHPAGRGT